MQTLFVCSTSMEITSAIRIESFPSVELYSPATTSPHSLPTHAIYGRLTGPSRLVVSMRRVSKMVRRPHSMPRARSRWASLKVKNRETAHFGIKNGRTSSRERGEQYVKNWGGDETIK